MGSNGGGDGGGEPQPRRAESGGLGRLSSLYDLTLDEVQHQLGDLGKPLSSMNLDELLKSVWTAESNMNVDYSHLGQHVPGPSLARQSSINLAQDLRKKTVDEVWQGIQQGKNKGSNNSSGSGNNDGDKREKTVERRQKRMIKNRESAARSRARKQAYTHELENKISRLEEENELLKRQKEVGMVLPSAPPPKPKYQLRRTSSASF
ncbi:putative transcription factor bZIP family [Helianthus annuus]|nr:putative transcription factor bZIP family [Helianthus annuus]KAJ0573609.1 putative transcription factor bZIP family [Helianthus annuus]KAJ0737972.1 putative transcription factor bZIP family [Helianthus annuus]